MDQKKEEMVVEIWQKEWIVGRVKTSKPAFESYESLSSIANLITTPAKTREEFIEECKKGKLDGVLVIFRTFQSVSVTGRFDEELVKELPKSVKFVCHNGAGYDQIDVEVCTKHNIHISNVPTAVDNCTADTTVFLILSALRGFNSTLNALRQGKWRGDPPPPLGHDPEGKVLGILGMGGIGRNLKKKMDAFGMKVQYYNRRKLDDEAAGGAKYVEFEELLKTSDILSINVPLNPKTRHMLSGPQFDLMKPGVVIVNTARGAVMDEAALVKALDSGKVASVGLDVYEEEPKVHEGLVNNERVTLLPHMGTWTVETQTAMEMWNIQNVKMAIEKGRLKSPVPEQEDMPYD
ncbi:MAG: hypothetical protein MMC33_006334 [Icmadophila ericetorum]|nr:hypothetical protein [Icmadophila ericetorum]